MKKFLYFLVAFVFTAVSCTREMDVEPAVSTGYELLLQTRVDGMATKAADIPELKEDDIQTLDVYISGTFKDGTGIKHFSLSAGNDLIGSQTWRVSADWRTDNFVIGNSYTAYVAANSSKVKASADSGNPAVATTTLSGLSLTTLAGLKNAIEFDYDPAESNGEGGKYPFWGPHTSGSVNPSLLGVHKLYTEGSISSAGADASRYFTDDKSFLMNGTASFTATLDLDGNNILVTDAVTLTRAAAKIAVNIQFNPTYLSTRQLTPCGQPKWRFCNFAFNTPIFSDLTPDPAPTISQFTSEGEAGMSLYASLSTGSEYSTDSDKHFSFATYSYPLSWTAETADSNAPAIIVSVCYRDDSDTGIPEASRPVKWQDYKIPVVNPEAGIFSLDRNKIYTIDATITDGTLDPDPYDYEAAYRILPWDSVNSVPVSKRDNSYIDVIPDAIAEHSGTQKVVDVFLHGNGQQSFRLEVLKPKTKSFAIAYYTGTEAAGASYDNPFGQTGTPIPYPLTGTYVGKKGNVYSNAATGAQVPYYINLNGNIRNTIGNSATPADNYIQNCFVKEDDEHLLIISDALPNKGIKFMKIRVYLESDPSIYMDVNIRHYPTDAIISIEGRWSSRQSAAVVAGLIAASDVIPSPEDIFDATHAGFNTAKIAYSDNKSDYDSWDGYKTWRWRKCTFSEYEAATERRKEEGGRITRDEFKAHVSPVNDYVDGTPETGYGRHRGDYTDGVFYNNSGAFGPMSNSSLSTSYWKTATSELDALPGITENSDPVYYWGTSPSESGASSSYYDYKEGTGTSSKYYVYNNHKYVYYTGIVYYRKRYYHLDPTKSASIWPNWVKDYGNTTFTAGAYFNRSTTSETFSARIITDVKSGSNGAITTDNGVQKVTKGIDWDSGSYPATSTASGYPSTAVGDWCMFFGNRGSGSMTFEAAKNPRDVSKNRYMYVLQLSESSSDYTIGRPILEDDYTSEDDVVSPAFMIASQLGSTNGSLSGAYAGKWAALHCATYLEVSSDGTYYMDWRLPTKAEIQAIINYQGNSLGTATLVPGSPVSNDDRVMEPVLFARAYYALDGSTVLTNYGAGSSETTVRCVRDLSSEEIEALDK